MKKAVVQLLVLLIVLFEAHAEITLEDIKQLSLTKTGGAPTGFSDQPMVSPNRRLAVFRSYSSDLVDNDTNNFDDVFYSLQGQGAVTRASVNSSSEESTSISSEPAISAVLPDGLFAITFSSTATNLGNVAVTGQSNNIFLRVPSLGLTEVVSLGTDGKSGNSHSYLSSVALIPGSPVKVLIAFVSQADNLVSNDTNGKADIFLASANLPKSGGFPNPSSAFKIKRISVTSDGTEANGDSYSPRISADGRFVVFGSDATNLYTAQTPSGIQIYRYTVASGLLELVSKNSAGAPADGNCTSPSISFSGRYVAYSSQAENLLSNGDPDLKEIFAHDLNTGAISRVNVTKDGVLSNGNGIEPNISGNGRLVAFSDSGNNLATSDSNFVQDVFVKDLNTGDVARISTAPSEESRAASDSPFMTGDSYNDLTTGILFRSFATNLTSPSTALGAGDIFGRAFTVEPPQLNNGAKIETPPDIEILNRRIVISAQEFNPSGAAASLLGGDSERPSSRANQVVRYDYRIRGLGKRKQVRLDLTSKRNSITTSKLGAGNYNTRYRARVVQGKTTVATTAFSPRLRVQIP